MFKKKCFICKQKDEKINLEKDEEICYDWYQTYYYHKDCLEYASCNAKEYNSNILDLIIDIVNNIKRKKARRASLLLKCNKICKEFKELNKTPTGNSNDR